MQPTPIQTTSSAVKRPREASASSGRNRPGSRARLASRLRIEDTPTGAARQHTLSSPNDFPPLTFGLLDGDVFDSQPRAASDVGEGEGGGERDGEGGTAVTGILARPADVGAGTSMAVAGDGGSMGMELGMGMGQPLFPQLSMVPRSFSAGFATSLFEFMGGRRGEISPDGPQVSSYLGPPQFSRRGNLLPPRPSTGGASTYSSTAAHPPTSKPAPNQFAMTAAAGTSLTHRSAEYEVGKNFDRLRTQGAHLGLTTSPYFPKCKEDLVKHREERKNEAKDAMSRRIREKEELMRLKSMEGCEGALVRIKPAFGGKVFRDGLSGMLARKTTWGHPSLDAKLPEMVDWPSLTEVKHAGYKKAGLPIPRYLAEEGMAGEYFQYFAGDRFGVARRAARSVVFDDDDIEEMGDMKSLLKEIDA
ncbi:hypothetical protein DSL72_001384 [Monilinia vaccinii-corymbosi]|uniref:Uncharacterized protein n=1 Tax=Monilinia vaccinii-corymbosi TaxID=61207 RepID=A0A8A3P1P8_9HELO|nr:hypothetical protein DSL72_001384 [Monilinia vaccinii-corymbosi]